MTTHEILTCQSFIDQIDDFVDLALDEDSQRACERHLKSCRDCTAYLDSYLQMLKALRSANRNRDAY